MDEALKHQLVSFLKTVKTHGENIQQGKTIDSKDLHQKGSILCDKIQKSDPQTAKALKPLLSDLITELDKLALRLEEKTK